MRIALAKSVDGSSHSAFACSAFAECNDGMPPIKKPNRTRSMESLKRLRFPLKPRGPVRIGMMERIGRRRRRVEVNEQAVCESEG